MSYNPGQADLLNLTVETRLGPVDLRAHVIALNVLETVYDPVITAEITLRDTKELSGNLGITGGERVTISFETAGREPVEYNLVVDTIIEAEPDENLRSKTYTIECMSREGFLSMSRLLYKSYNTNISFMVNDILTGFLGTRRPVDVQETKGIQKIYIQSEKPFEAIDMLRKRAVSIDDKPSMFAFFENHDGFHFKTFETLFKNNDVGDRVFVQRRTVNDDIENSNFRSIFGFSSPKQFSTLDRIGLGLYTNEIATFDLKTLDYRYRTINTDRSQYTTPNGKLKTSTSRAKTEFGSTPAIAHYVPFDSSSPESYISSIAPDRAAAAAQLLQSSMTINVNGDTELRAGQVIQTDIPNLDVGEDDRLSDIYSGKHLIIALKHVIQFATNEPKYMCYIDCIKGGYTGDLNH